MALGTQKGGRRSRKAGGCCIRCSFCVELSVHGKTIVNFFKPLEEYVSPPSLFLTWKTVESSKGRSAVFDGNGGLMRLFVSVTARDSSSELRERERERQRQTERETERQRERDRQTDMPTDRQTDRQTEPAE